MIQLHALTLEIFYNNNISIFEKKDYVEIRNMQICKRRVCRKV